jgi:predicted permease
MVVKSLAVVPAYCRGGGGRNRGAPKPRDWLGQRGDGTICVRPRQAMDNFILLVACFVLGIALRASGRLPETAPSTLNGFIVNVSLPALTLVYVHSLTLDATLLFAAAMAWVLFGCGWLFFATLGKALRLPRTTVGALTLTGAMANTSFIGLPMIEMWYGRDRLGIGIVADQLGSYLVLSTLGVLLAGVYSGGGRKFDARALARKLATFMPFVSLLLALALIPVAYPTWLEELLKRLGGTLVPLALVSVGFQLRLSQIRGRALALACGLAFKLVLGPLIVGLIFIGLLAQRGPVIQVTVFEAAMGPMIGAAIVAMDHDLDPALVTLMVGIGIPLSFATLPVWWWLLRGFG